MRIFDTIIKKNNIFSFTLSILFLSFFATTRAQNTYSLYVGDNQRLVAPNPPTGSIYQTAWGAYGAHLRVTKNGTYDATVTVTSYFEGSEQVQCDYYWKWYDRNGRMYTNHATTYYLIKCKQVTITPSPNNLTLYVGEGKQISYTVTPSNVSTKPTVQFVSKNNNVAQVNSNGYVKAVGAGSTYITLNNSMGSSASVSVTVKNANINVNEIVLNNKSVSLEKGESKQLSATIYPSNATNKNVTWSSNNTSVASVSSTGLVTAKSEGTSTITCKASDGSGVSAKCEVNVKKKDVNVSSIVLSPTYASLKVGETKELKVTIYPSNATNKTVTWSSNKTSVATVSSTGLVTAKSEGTAIITCKANDGSGISEKCEINVKKNIVYVSSMVLSPTYASLKVGETKELKVTIYPSNATNKTVTWSSNKISVATVSSTGLVTAKSEGTAIITCKANDGSGISENCEINIKKDVVPVSSIVLNPTYASLKVGETLNLKPTFYPSNATNKEVTWSSSNTSVVSVSSTGLVTAKSKGSSTITCKASDGSGVNAKCEVDVKNLLASGVEGNLKWELNDKYTLTIFGQGDMKDYIDTTPPWDEYFDVVKSIVINDGITSISDAAFFYFPEVSTVSLPNTLTSIGHDAFNYCSKLRTISIPNSVVSIRDYAFNGCSLTSISLSNNVKEIGEAAFACRTLKDISVESSNRYFASIDGALFDKSHSTIIQYPGARKEEYIVPDNVICIGGGAFRLSSLSNVVLPKSLVEIGGLAFCESDLKEVILPETVEYIGYGAFMNCKYLVSVKSYIKEIFEIGEDDFDFNTSKTLYVPQGMKSIYKSTKGWNNFKNIIEMDMNSIQGITINEIPNKKVHGLSGIKYSTPIKGVNILNRKKILLK